MKMRIFLFSLLLAAVLDAGTITVAVAANVGYAVGDLVSAFTAKHPGTRVRTVLGSSGKLTAQIEKGAPYGVFLSADMRYPRSLYEHGRALAPPRVYALGALALLSVKPRDFSRGLKLLLDPALRRIAVANPETAPYGIAAREALEHAGIYDRVANRFVYGESVSQTVFYTLHAADIGIVAASALHDPKLRRFEEGVNWTAVDPALYTPIEQGAVLLSAGRARPECRAFYDFLFTPEAQAVFRRYGYRVR
jgi:molybdate transport system substrate-binding protein